MMNTLYNKNEKNIEIFGKYNGTNINSPLALIDSVEETLFDNEYKAVTDVNSYADKHRRKHFADRYDGRTTNVYIRQMWKCPVPDRSEVKLLFDLFPDYHPVLLALGFIAIEGTRPSEGVDLRWTWFEIEKSGNIPYFRHIVYKPTNRKCKIKNSEYFKEVRKKMHSPWLVRQLQEYRKIYPEYEDKRVFSFTTPDTINKFFTKMRAALKDPEKKRDFPPGCECFLDKNVIPVKGPDCCSQFRIYPYSLRKFCITFHYYVTFKEDAVATSKYFGHSDPTTTLKYYIQPKEAIGLTQEMIDKNISIDEFIFREGRPQTGIIEFDADADYAKCFLPVGQKLMRDYREQTMIIKN